MSKTKKSSRKPTVRVADMNPKQDPKGGADIVITKVVDKSSTTLLQSCATGEHVIK